MLDPSFPRQPIDTTAMEKRVFISCGEKPYWPQNEGARGKKRRKLITCDNEYTESEKQHWQT